MSNNDVPQEQLDEKQATTEQETDSETTASDENLQQHLAEAEAKAKEHWDQLLRVKAEQENLRRRHEREVQNAHKYALERFASELLPVRDSLEMGLAAFETDNTAKHKEGIELTLHMMTGAMDKFEIREVNPQDEAFDPDYHQAMSIQERADVDPNTVVTVVQKGYLLNDRLIRPAMVIVSKAPDAA